MFNRNQALVIIAGVALAFAPRFEAKVQEFAQTHRTEIQMAMNELQGKPAIPFAAPEAAPIAAREPAAEAQARFEMAQMREDSAPRVEMIRAQVAAMHPVIRKATRVRLEQLA